MLRWLRWAVVLALVCFLWGNLVHVALGPEARAIRPAPLAVVLEQMGMLRFHLLPEAALVVAGATIAPRARRTTAIVLAAATVPMSFWGHVLATGGPWWFWTINYTHFTLEAFGSVLGVVYIFWSEKAKPPMASVPPATPPP